MSALKLLGKDGEDVAIISSSLQDAILRVSDISYEKGSRALSLRLWRYRNEAGVKERVLTGLRFDDVISVRSRGITRDNPESYLVLLNIRFEPEDLFDDSPSGIIHLTFAGDGVIQVIVEAPEVICADVSDPSPTEVSPLHPDLDTLLDPLLGASG